MKSPDEIKKGLECCAASYADCHKECPYKLDCDGSQILKDALALIQQLQADKIGLLESSHEIRKDMLARIHRLEAERDELIEAIKEWSPFNIFPLPCKFCKNVKEAFCGEKCKWCRENSNFEWRGVPKEE